MHRGLRRPSPCAVCAPLPLSDSSPFAADQYLAQIRAPRCLPSPFIGLTALPSFHAQPLFKLESIPLTRHRVRGEISRSFGTLRSQSGSLLETSPRPAAATRWLPSARY